jgi:hypothetical protein
MNFEVAYPLPAHPFFLSFHPAPFWPAAGRSDRALNFSSVTRFWETTRMLISSYSTKNPYFSIPHFLSAGHFNPH